MILATAFIIYAGGLPHQRGTCDLDNALFRTCLEQHALELVKLPEPQATHVVIDPKTHVVRLVK
jgi:hypothetical protein